jgi:RecG-like helicase
LYTEGFSVDLSTPVTYLKGVGPQRAKHLEAKGLRTAADLLTYAPFRYEDRTNVKPLKDLAPGEQATVLVRVESFRAVRLGRRELGLREVTFTDGHGGRLLGKWFHAAYLSNVFSPGLRVALYGRVEYDSYRGELSMVHPEYEVLRDDEEEEEGLHTGRIVPVYEAAGKVTTRMLRTILRRLLDRLDRLLDPLPETLRHRLRLPGLLEAIRELHFPSPGSDLRRLESFRTLAQYRMIFEEFFWLETGMALRRREAQLEPGIAFELNDRIREQVRRILPFRLTNAQKRVVREIAHDMARPRPMNRLLQGDVGSGKTIVAGQAAIIAIENGYQAALLAPTEILAMQHYFNLRRVLEPLAYTIVPLTGSLTKKEREFARRAAQEGQAQLVVGTHALLEEAVSFHRLGLALIDEQHRLACCSGKACNRRA